MQHHRLLLPLRLVAAMLVVLAAQQARAVCTPSVSASVANDMLTMQASVSGACGSTGVSLFVDGSHVGGKSCPGQTSCEHTLTMPTYCMSTGAHTVTATARCMYQRPNPDGTTSCVSDTEGTASTTFSVSTQPSVSFSYDGPDASGNGTLIANYAFPNTGVPSHRALGLWVNGGWVAGDAPQQQTGTWTYPLSTTCWASGPHSLAVVAQARCLVMERAEASSTLVVNTKPDVAISFTPNPAGPGTVTIPFSFPNTASSLQRSVGFWIDGGHSLGYKPVEREGSWTFPFEPRCDAPTRIRATAEACGPGERDEAETTIPKPAEPHVTVTLRKGPMNAATGRRSIIGRLDYDMGEARSGWSVRADLLSWTTADGQTHAGGQLVAPFVPAERVGTRTFEFLPPHAARQVTVLGTASSCSGRAASEASIDCGCDGTNDPVYFADGNVRVTDADPLPPIGQQRLVRTYDSDEQVVGLFGRGWTTVFDRRLIVNSAAGEQIVSFVTATNDVVTFRGAGGAFRQTWPTAAGALDTLRYDPLSGTYAHRAAGSDEVAVFRASDGKLTALRDAATGREALIVHDAAGLPQTLTDSWSGIRWTLTVGADRRVSSIAVSDRPDLVWTYVYDGSGNLTAVLAPGGAAWRTYEYLGHRMTASRDGAGNLIESHTYDADGQGMSSTGPGDEIALIEYGLAGIAADERVTRVTYKTGAAASYALRPAGGAYRIARAAGGCGSCGAHEATYVRDSRGRVVREQDARGYVTERAYDPVTHNLVTATTSLQPADCDPATDSGRCRMTPDTLAAVALLPTRATLATTYEYGDANWPERPTVIRSGSVQAMTYDAATGTVLTQSVAGWSAGVQQTRTTSATLYDGVEPAAFDPGGAFAWPSSPQPRGLRKSVDGPRGDVADVTSYVYYPLDPAVPPLLRGRLAAIRDAAGHVVRHEDYDVFGNPTRVVDANGVVTELAHDSLGRLTTSTVPGSPGCDPAADPLCATDLVQTRTYAQAGPLRTEQHAGGAVSSYAYDSRGRVQSISRGPSAADPREQVEYAYDSLTGKESLERTLARENGAWVEKKREAFQYDGLGLLHRVVHADGAYVEYSYDGAHQIAGVRDENHGAPNTTYEYDPAGRMEKVTQTLAGAPGGAVVTRYTYDARGNLSGVVDPNGNTTSYSFDDFGQLTSQQSPVTGTTTYAYDLAGNLTRTTDANGAVTVRTYDVLGRVLSAASTRNGVTETVSWTYDAPDPGAYGLGRLASMTDPSGLTTYAYERRGLLREETREAFLQRYGYDADGNRTSIRYPSGRTVTYQYDYAGRPTAATGSHGGQTTAYVTAAAYLPFGPLTSLTLGNGTTETRTFDARYRPLVSSLVSGVATLARYVYTSDPAGNITAIADDLAPAYNRTFAYDDLNRLTTANTGTGLWGSGSYTYDAMGNLLTATLGAAHRSFTYEGTTPKVRTATGLVGTMTYDPAGNELKSPAGAPSGGLPAARYSPRNLLAAQYVREYDRCTEEPGRICVVPEYVQVWLEHRHDGRGVRVASAEVHVSGTISTEDPEPQWVAYFYTPELSMLNTPTADVIWFGSRPVADHDPTTVRYTYTDHLGTPILQTSPTATIVWRAEYEPYGTVHTLRAGTSPAAQPLRFPGQQLAFTNATGEESYNIFRWYRAGWGRYTQSDPLLNLGTALTLRQFMGDDAPTPDFGELNWYDYVGNNPLDSIDPWGLTPFKKCVLVGDVIKDTVLESTTSTPAPGGSIVRRTRRIVRRYCFYRCYCDVPDLCHKIPCLNPFCDRDHGVSIKLNKYNTSGVRPCKNFVAEAMAQGKCP